MTTNAMPQQPYPQSLPQVSLPADGVEKVASPIMYHVVFRPLYAVWSVYLRRIEQVTDPLHVNLDHRALQNELRVFIRVHYVCKDSLDHPRVDAHQLTVEKRWSFHRVRLPTCTLVERRAVKCLYEVYTVSLATLR